ncbi:MAG TPA: VanZ family protein [Leptolinea sp.]
MKFIRITTILFIFAFFLIILAANRGGIPAWIYSFYNYPNGDKVGHFVLFGLMAFLINCSYPEQVNRIFSLPIPTGSLIVAVLASLEELSQVFFPTRTSSLLDLSASFLGIIVFSYLSLFVIKLYKKT